MYVRSDAMPAASLRPKNPLIEKYIAPAAIRTSAAAVMRPPVDLSNSRIFSTTLPFRAPTRRGTSNTHNTHDDTARPKKRQARRTIRTERPARDSDWVKVAQRPPPAVRRYGVFTSPWGAAVRLIRSLRRSV